MLIILFFIFFIASVFGIAYVVRPYWPQLQSIDIQEHVAASKLSIIKSSILEDRLKRKVFTPVSILWKHLRPVLKLAHTHLKRWYRSIREKERQYREAAEQIRFARKEKHEQEVVIEEKLEHLDGANGLGDLEMQYIEILSLDPKNIDAYEGLGRLYIKQEDYTQAQEVFEHILKLGGNKVEYFLNLAECLTYFGHTKQAWQILKRAHKREARNPKIFDKMIELAILMKDKIRAKQYVKELSGVNPQNNKIQEYIDKIKKI